LFSNVLLALLLDDGQSILLEHTHGLTLPFWLSRLAYGSPTTSAIIISVAPIAIVMSWIASRVSSCVEHVVIAIVAGSVSAIALVVARFVAPVTVLIAWWAIMSVVALVTVAILGLVVAASTWWVVLVVRVV
jgi:hypothetical protein